MNETVKNFDTLPDSALVDIGVVTAILGVSVPTIWRWTKNAAFPGPLRIGKNCTRWRVGDIRGYLINSNSRSA